jgi:hypothetical protein
LPGDLNRTIRRVRNDRNTRADASASALAFTEVAMENNSTQGLALLVLLVAFVFLSISLFYGGSIVALLLAIVTMAGAIAMFRKAKALETQ